MLNLQVVIWGKVVWGNEATFPAKGKRVLVFSKESYPFVATLNYDRLEACRIWDKGQGITCHINDGDVWCYLPDFPVKYRDTAYLR